MPRTASLMRVAWIALAAGSVVKAEPRVQTHVTIKGTGSNVTIERSAAPSPQHAVVRGGAGGDLLDEAVRMKADGRSDEAVVSYLRANRAALPAVIDADDLQTLRLAGAGEPVTEYLESVAALDIGETAEPAQGMPMEMASGGEAEGYPADYGYGYGGYGYGGYGYGAAYAAGWYRGRFGGRGIRVHPVVVHARHPVAHPMHPMHAPTGPLHAIAPHPHRMG